MVTFGMGGDFHAGNAIFRSFGGKSFKRIVGATSAIFAGYGRRAGRSFESGSTNWRMTRPRALGESFSRCPNQECVNGDLAERGRQFRGCDTYLLTALGRRGDGNAEYRTRSAEQRIMKGRRGATATENIEYRTPNNES